MSESASMRGRTRKSIGGTAMVESASISWFTCMVPSSAAKPEPVRPAMMIPVMIGASSRTVAMATRSAT